MNCQFICELDTIAKTLGVAAVAAATCVNAYNIDFSPLPGPNEAAYAGHSQGGFTVTPTAGNWRQGFLFGNPTPSIFSRSTLALVNVTGGLFTFEMADFGNGGSSGFPAFSAHGFLNNVEVLTGGPSVFPNNGAFFTLVSPNNSIVLDRLQITATLGDGTSFNVDNIVVNSVPEAGHLSLVGLGLLGLVVMRRSRWGIES